MNKFAKKFFSIFLCITMLLVMTACGNQGGASEEESIMPEEYEYDDFSEFIELGDYKDLEYDRVDVQVTQDEIDSNIKTLLEDTAETKKIKSGVVKSDSIVNIDYVGSIDGVEFDGGSAEGMDLDIGNNNFIEGFAEGIVGHEVGETFDLHVTFPEDYGNADLAGKPAVFVTTINYLEEEVLPECTDEWVKKNTDYKSKKALEEGVREELTSNKMTQAVKDQKMGLFQTIVDNSTIITYPEKELLARQIQLEKMYESYASTMGMNLVDYLDEQMGMSEEEFDLLAEESAKVEVHQELVMHAIAQLEGIRISEKEYKDYLLGLLKDANYTEESFKTSQGVTIYQYAKRNNMMSSLLYDKVMDKVMEYSVEK